MSRCCTPGNIIVVAAIAEDAQIMMGVITIGSSSLSPLASLDDKFLQFRYKRLQYILQGYNDRGRL